MSDIKKITDEILAEAQSQANEMVAQAQEAAAEKIALARKDSEGIAQQIRGRGQEEAQLASSRLSSGTSLKIRDAKLSAKRSMIDKVMDLVRSKIRQLPKEEELKYILEDLKERPLSPDETLVVRQGLGQEVQNATGITNLTEEADLSGYHIIRKGVRENHSLEATLDYLKEDLEGIASKNLFE